MPLHGVLPVVILLAELFQRDVFIMKFRMFTFHLFLVQVAYRHSMAADDLGCAFMVVGRRRLPPLARVVD